MFHNKEDIDFFKPIKLRTRCGRLGHIKESLGKWHYCERQWLQNHDVFFVTFFRNTRSHEMCFWWPNEVIRHHIHVLVQTSFPQMDIRRVHRISRWWGSAPWCERYWNGRLECTMSCIAQSRPIHLKRKPKNIWNFNVEWCLIKMIVWWHIWINTKRLPI